ncbi:sugar phosphate isomerase/epimerase [Halobacillus fulvus]|nr:sugar phosphate isomerase/epimerase [Halobacillus fulvus]
MIQSNRGADEVKIGVNAWCFPASMNAGEVLQKAEEYAYDGIELNLEDKAPGIFTMDSIQSDIESIKQQAEKHNLEIYSISTDLLWKYPLSSKDPDTREKGIAVVEKMLSIAEICGASSVLVVPGIVREGERYDEVYNRSMDAIKDLAEKAEQKKIQIGIENVWNDFLLSPLEFSSYIEEIGSDYVGAYLDIGNLFRTGYPDQWIELMKNRIVNVHVKDFKRSAGNDDGFVPLLAGDLNWSAVAESLDEVGYEGYVAPEIPPHKHHHELLLKQTAETMHYFFKVRRVVRK